jgi:hypothetical protein
MSKFLGAAAASVVFISTLGAMAGKPASEPIGISPIRLFAAATLDVQTAIVADQCESALTVHVARDRLGTAAFMQYAGIEKALLRRYQESKGTDSVLDEMNREFCAAARPIVEANAKAAAPIVAQTDKPPEVKAKPKRKAKAKRKVKPKRLIRLVRIICTCSL